MHHGYFNTLSLALRYLGPDSGVLSYMYDLIGINHTFDSHLVSLEKMFAALQAAVLSLTHWRLYLWGRQLGRRSTCCTDHQALTHLYHMQDTYNANSLGYLSPKL